MNSKHVLLPALLVATLGLSAPEPARAQWATFDISNFLQNVQQVQEVQSQLSKMQEQLAQAQRTADQAKQTYDSFTGSRGKGELFRDAANAYAPQQLADVTNLANEIKQKAGFLSTQDLSGINEAYRKTIQQRGDDAANDQAAMQRIFDQSAAEFATITGLMDDITHTSDPKGIADLQARIQTQQAQLQNQLIRAQAMTALMQMKDRMSQQSQLKDMANENLDYYKE